MSYPYGSFPQPEQPLWSSGIKGEVEYISKAVAFIIAFSLPPSVCKDLPTDGRLLPTSGSCLPSVFYDVLMRETPEQTEPNQIGEVWHFSRDDRKTGSFWALKGIQQVD
jgi:hypothetical protein